MKKIITILLLLASVFPSWAYSFYDFSPSGQPLYYNISSDTTVYVTYPGGTSYWNRYIKPEDTLIIPAYVTHSGNTYAVTAIGQYAFYDCNGLTNVTIPNTVTSIGEYAFYNCYSLTTVTIPSSITSIGGYAFYDCVSLTGDFTIPNSVTTVGGNTFYGCRSLTSVTIPTSVTSIGGYAFSGCTGLTSVTIPNSVTSIGTSAFYYVRNIIYHGVAYGVPWDAWSVNGFVEDSLIYSNSTKTTLVGSSPYVATVTIPNSVTSIDGHAFSGCSGLTSVTIPSSVTYISSVTFNNCTSLDTIICIATTPPEARSNSFTNVPSSVTVIVPCGSASLYRSSWSWFSNFVEDGPFGVSASSANNSHGSVSTSDISCSSATILASPNYGFYFDHWNDNSTENPRTIDLTQDTSFVAYFIPADPFLVYLHDTTYVDRWQYDTTYLHDTTYVDRWQYDTTYIHDTTIVDRWQFDTTYIHDTTYVDCWQYDTTYIDNYIHDTLFLDIDYNHISVISGNPSRGLVAGNGDFPRGTQVEIAAIPIRGSQFVSWQDGNTDNPRTVSLDEDLVFVATFDALEGIADLQPTDYSISAQGNRMVISGVADRRVRIFDSVGRLLDTADGHNDVAVFQAPSMGVFLVQVGDSPAQKVVIR